MSSVCRELNLNIPNKKDIRERKKKGVLGQSTLKGVIAYIRDYQYSLLIYRVM